jgi:hypothetical protein
MLLDDIEDVVPESKDREPPLIVIHQSKPDLHKSRTVHEDSVIGIMRAAQRQ